MFGSGLRKFFFPIKTSYSFLLSEKCSAPRAINNYESDRLEIFSKRFGVLLLTKSQPYPSQTSAPHPHRNAYCDGARMFTHRWILCFSNSILTLPRRTRLAVIIIIIIYRSRNTIMRKWEPKITAIPVAYVSPSFKPKRVFWRRSCVFTHRWILRFSNSISTLPRRIYAPRYNYNYLVAKYDNAKVGTSL